MKVVVGTKYTLSSVTEAQALIGLVAGNTYTVVFVSPKREGTCVVEWAEHGCSKKATVSTAALKALPSPEDAYRIAHANYKVTKELHDALQNAVYESTEKLKQAESELRRAERDAHQALRQRIGLVESAVTEKIVINMVTPMNYQELSQKYLRDRMKAFPINFTPND